MRSVMMSVLCLTMAFGSVLVIVATPVLEIVFGNEVRPFVLLYLVPYQPCVALVQSLQTKPTLSFDLLNFLALKLKANFCLRRFLLES